MSIVKTFGNTKFSYLHSLIVSCFYIPQFNLAIPEVPEVTIDTKRVLNGEVVAALSQVFIVEISLTTSDGDEMILELWTIKMDPECDPAMNSLSTIYYRMGIMLKSTLTISRIVPAYKISRCQSSESYKISYRIYSGQPDTDLLGKLLILISLLFSIFFWLNILLFSYLA